MERRMSLLSGHRVAVIDVETTGWDPAADAIVEIAVVTVAGGETGGEWATLVSPGRPVPESATRVHGIDDRLLAGAPAPDEVAPAVRARCEADALALHNARFDLPFVNALLRSAGLASLLAPVVDTLGLARGLGDGEGNTLGELAQRFGVPHAGLHRALPDARVTAALLVRLAARWQAERGVRNLSELAAASLDALRLSSRRIRAAVEPART
jgi:DNA polymerase-3 subunit epsilon